MYYDKLLEISLSVGVRKEERALQLRVTILPKRDYSAAALFLSVEELVA